MTDEIKSAPFKLACTYDMCVGDEILFTEPIYAGKYPALVYRGRRRVTARVIGETFGRKTGSKSVSLTITASDGLDPLPSGRRVSRRVHKLLKARAWRKAWKDEDKRANLIASLKPL